MPTISNLAGGANNSNSGSGTFTWSADCATVSGRTNQTGDTLTLTANAGGAGVWTNTGLQAGASVRLDVWGTTSGGVKSAEVTLFWSTPQNLPPPQVPPSSISATQINQRSPKQMRVSWSTVAGATGYRLYKSSDGSSYFPVVGTDGQVGNVSSYTANVDYEWQNYWFQVTATNAYGNAPNAFNGAWKSNDSYAPVLNQFYTTDVQKNQISVYAKGSDTVPDAGSMSGVGGATFYKDGVSQGQSGANASGEVYFTYTNLQADTPYNLTCAIYDNDSNFSGQTIPLNPRTLPAIPTGKPVLTTVTAKAGKLVDLVWTGSTGATKYEVYKAYEGGADTYATETTGLSISNVPIDAEYRNYTFKIKPWNSAGYGTTSDGVIVKSRDDTFPTYTDYYSTLQSTTQITTLLTGVTDPIPNTTPASASSGLASFDLFKALHNQTLGYVETKNFVSGTDFYYTFTGLTAGTSYDFQIRIKDVQGNVTTSKTINYSTTNRPVNFAWTNAKVSGGDFNVTASEWIGFQTRINQFRVYKGLANYGFSTPASGDAFQVFYYTQARTAINDMTPPTAVPPTRATGDTIFASDFNTLRDSLNSIT